MHYTVGPEPLKNILFKEYHFLTALSRP